MVTFEVAEVAVHNRGVVGAAGLHPQARLLLRVAVEPAPIENHSRRARSVHLSITIKVSPRSILKLN